MVPQAHRLARLGTKLLDITNPSHFTFQSQSCVIEFEQLSSIEQMRLQKSVSYLLNSSISKIERPQYHPHRHDLLEIWDDLNDLNSTPTPQIFIDALQKIAPHGIAWHQTSYFGGTALHWAVRFRRIDVIHYLLNLCEGRAMLNLADNYIGETPLMTAVSSKFIPLDADRKEIVSLLLEAQANPNLISNEKFTPLHVAAETGALSLVLLFLRHPTATINPALPLSDKASKALYYVYYQIEKALKEGLNIFILHFDLHPIILSYCLRC